MSLVLENYPPYGSVVVNGNQLSGNDIRFSYQPPRKAQLVQESSEFLSWRLDTDLMFLMFALSLDELMLRQEAPSPDWPRDVPGYYGLNTKKGVHVWINSEGLAVVRDQWKLVKLAQVGDVYPFEEGRLVVAE